jgi:DNA-binding MarR family transcriptional regulator
MSPSSARPDPPPPTTNPDVAWLDDEEKRAWLALLEVGTGLFELLDRDLKAMAGITLEDYEILHLLSAADQHRLRVGELANRMLASRTRLSQRIDRLAKRGLVRRERCPEDGRAINVVLTDEGEDLLVRTAPRHLVSVRSRVFDHLTRTDVTSLGRSLDKLVESIRAASTQT